MRILLLLAVLGCEYPEPAPHHAVVDVPAPPPKVVLGPGGACPHPPPPPPPAIARTLEVSQDLHAVRPLRKGGFTSYELGYDRGRPDDAFSIGLTPAIVGGKLQLSTFPTSCETTNAGCMDGYWSRPAQVVFEDPSPVAGCIAYAFALPGGLVIGMGTEIRTYLRHADDSLAVGPRVAVPRLEQLTMLANRAILQEPDGALWTATWDGTTAPVLAPSTRLPGHVNSAVRGADDLLLAYTDAALFALDEGTLAPRWSVPGEVWSVKTLDVPLTHYVLTVDRTAKPKVILRLLDAAGTEQKRVTVFEGDVSEAHLERSMIPVTPDRYDGVWIVHIAP